MTRVGLACLVTTTAALSTVPAGALAADLKIATTDAKNITAYGATLNADVDHAVDGGQVTWQYGPTNAYGNTTLPVTVAAQDARQKPTLPLACLTPGTSYHVRAVVTDGVTTAYGGDKSFKTQAANGTAAPAECTADPGGGGDTSGDGTSTSGGTGTTTTPTTTTTTGSTTAPGTTTTTTTATGTPPAPRSPDATPSGYLGGSDGSGAVAEPGVATEDVKPVLGRTLGAAAVTGKVKATAPSGAPLDLATARAIPSGTVIDTRAGAVELKTAIDGGRVQVARFWGGKFEVRQNATGKGLTQLVLRGSDFSGCRATTARSAAAVAAAKKKKPRPRSLWGSDDHGRFETRGRGSVATVRGTRWLTQDTCAGTRTRVAAGAVAVRDLRTHRTVVVRKGHEYLARVAR
jgi:hypothetical protein